MLLFKGWNRHDNTGHDQASVKTRKHCPDDGFQSRAVPSSEAETMKSFAKDQSKSGKIYDQPRGPSIKMRFFQ